MINLLPPQYKKELAFEQMQRLLLVLGGAAMIFLICFALMLFTIRIYMKGQIQEEKLFATPTPKELQSRKEITQDVENANNSFAAVLHFYQSRVSPSAILNHISSDVPDGISLNSLTAASSGITIEGFAPTRDQLFVLRSNLQKDQFFKDINFPLSNLVNSADIHFSIHLYTK